MNSEIVLIIIGLIVLYIILNITNETFNIVQEIEKPMFAKKSDLKIEATLLKGHLPIGSKQAKKNINISKCDIEKYPKATGLITKYRENVDKYIRQSMLLNKPNHNLGFQPANVRFMDLMYNKPTQIGAIPLFKMNVPKNVKIPKIPQVSEEEDIFYEES